MNPASALQLTDAMLMQQVQAGGRPALGELYDRFAARAYRTALSVCHDRESAQDAVQDAFLSIWSSRATYEPARGSVAGWAMSIVRYRAVHLARRRALASMDDQEADWLEEQVARDDVPADFVARSDTEQLTELLARLPPAQSEVIRLGFFDGLTHQEIARRLALPPGTVKGRMRLGLTRLRGDLDNSSEGGDTAERDPNIVIDKKVAGRIHNGESRVIGVPPGRHAGNARLVLDRSSMAGGEPNGARLHEAQAVA